MIERATPSLGAYVSGFDLGALDPAAVASIEALILEHHVVCFRGQDIDPRQHVELTRNLGEIYRQPVVSGLAGYPEIVEVFGTRQATETWHQDSTHSVRPPKLSLLVARIVPDCGNDTQFTNQHRAYDTLSPRLQEMLGQLRAVHKTRPVTPDSNQGRYRDYALVEEEASHPVIRDHPVTGRKALYVNGLYTRHFEGMTESESAPLLNYLYGHCSAPEFSFRHRWRWGDVIIWDNASVQHCVIGDSPQDTERYMHRTTTIGDIPR